jgi:hypothetical protein
MSTTSRRLALPDEITVTWHIDDVAEVRPDLSVSKRRKVLDQVRRNYDANTGITWDVLEGQAAQLYPKR